MSPVAGELDALAQHDRAALAERWVRAFGCSPPRSSRSQLLVLALAWQVQMAELLGTGSPDRLLRSLRRSSVPTGPSLAPGTRLLREWQGRTHQVTVLPSGFEWNGVQYRSLSAIARSITGTAWSGPLFFGLRR